MVGETQVAQKARARWHTPTARVLEQLTVVWLFGILLLLDSATKVAFATPYWGWHHLRPSALSVSLLAVPLAAMWMPYFRWGACLIAAGAVGNTLWSFSPTGVPNPFVAQAGHVSVMDFWVGGVPDSAVAYNFADICVTLGSVMTFGLVLLWAIRRGRVAFAR